VLQALGDGFNLIILAFYLPTGPTDFLSAWAGLSQETQIATMNEVHAKGGFVTFSFGGKSVAN
jgi:hypothetical protein